ncbi:MAG: hypothetical protein PVI54_09635, partial [Desulfobacteraceae bacterium]
TLLALCGLCVGPFGMFVAVFICASFGGIAGMELFKKGGGKLYDLAPLINNSQIYHSPDHFLSEAVK